MSQVEYECEIWNHQLAWVSTRLQQEWWWLRPAALANARLFTMDQDTQGLQQTRVKRSASQTDAWWMFHCVNYRGERCFKNSESKSHQPRGWKLGRNQFNSKQLKKWNGESPHCSSPRLVYIFWRFPRSTQSRT